MGEGEWVRVSESEWASGRVGRCSFSHTPPSSSFSSTLAPHPTDQTDPTDPSDPSHTHHLDTPAVSLPLNHTHTIPSHTTTTTLGVIHSSSPHPPHPHLCRTTRMSTTQCRRPSRVYLDQRMVNMVGVPWGERVWTEGRVETLAV